MNPIKKLFSCLTGYWLHKTSQLPIGFSLIHDLKYRLRYKTVKTVFDVGANIGQSYTAYRNIFPQAAIYSFEPISSSFAQLQKEMSKDPLGFTERMALGEKNETIMVKLFSENSPLNSLKSDLMNDDTFAQTEAVEVKTLDNYCKAKGIRFIDLLKIDTEGFEIPVLKGAHDMLGSGNIGMIFLETGFRKTDLRHTPFNSLFNLLEEYDYSFFSLYDLSIDAWYYGDYYGNALFIHKSQFAK
jgi:FkbM family methyltransferase